MTQQHFILFDLDGTLVDSAPDLTGALNHTMAHLSLPPVAEESVRHMVGFGARRLIEQGGAYINGHRVESFDYLVSDTDLDDQETIVLRSGKKHFHKIEVKK